MSQRPIPVRGLVSMGLIAAGCGLSSQPLLATPAPSLTAAPQPTPAATAYPTPDLSTRPLVWFAPLPPLEVNSGRPFIGAEDYMELFSPDAPWQKAMDRIGVFEIYGGWAAYAPWTVYASDEELRQVIDFTNRNGLALAMEDSPIERPSECGTDSESWGGLRFNLETARRIKKLGGTLHFIAMDAPYYFMSLVDYPGACRWPAEKVAREIDAYIEGMKTEFPQVVVGDTEPLQAGMQPAVYKEWMDSFLETTGYSLPFFHMDLDYARPDWPERVRELEDYARQKGTEFGIIYFGNWNDPTDEAWLANTGERVKRYELVGGGRPDHVLFQSWHDHPDRTLPETDPYTYSALINQYFDDKTSLGFRREGAGANVALGKAAQASRSRGDQPPANAVDGNPGTVWGAGDFAPNWIEIDLGQPYAIGEIRLRLDQGELVGETIHRISVKGPSTDDKWVLLHTFEGVTSNFDQLFYAPPEVLEGIQFVRAEITLSPSWIAFREVEVIAAR